MRKSRSRLATCTEVTEEAAPTTPEMTLRGARAPAGATQRASAPSMLPIEPVGPSQEHENTTFHFCVKWNKNGN